MVMEKITNTLEWIFLNKTKHRLPATTIKHHIQQEESVEENQHRIISFHRFPLRDRVDFPNRDIYIMLDIIRSKNLSTQEKLNK